MGLKLDQHVQHDRDHYEEGNTSEDIVFSSHVNINEKDRGGKDKVNSLHHQIVNMRSIMDSDLPVIIAATSKKYTTEENDKKYGTIEALQYIEYPAITVQWHPELIWDHFSRQSIASLIAIND